MACVPVTISHTSPSHSSTHHSLWCTSYTEWHTIHSTPADAPVGFHWEGTPSPSCTGGEGGIKYIMLDCLNANEPLASSNNECTSSALNIADCVLAHIIEIQGQGQGNIF